MMKKAVFLTLFAALVTGAQAADYNYLVFTLTDGSTQAVASANLSITFDNGQLTATSGSSTLATVPLASLAKMEFSNTGTSGISTISTDQLTIGDATDIYDLNGHQLPKGSQLSRGIYILKGNGRTIKVQVK